MPLVKTHIISHHITSLFVITRGTQYFRDVLSRVLVTSVAFIKSFGVKFRKGHIRTPCYPVSNLYHDILNPQFDTSQDICPSPN